MIKITANEATVQFGNGTVGCHAKRDLRADNASLLFREYKKVPIGSECADLTAVSKKAVFLTFDSIRAFRRRNQSTEHSSRTSTGKGSRDMKTLKEYLDHAVETVQYQININCDLYHINYYLLGNVTPGFKCLGISLDHNTTDLTVSVRDDAGTILKKTIPSTGLAIPYELGRL